MRLMWTFRPAAAVTALLCAAAVVADLAGRGQTAQDAERSRMTGLYRDARAALDRAARPAATDDARRRLADHLERLAAAPAGGTPDFLSDELRGDIHRRARALRNEAGGGTPDADEIAACRALLDRVGAALAATPTLDFQGSYSQSKPKERVYGGHASGMGPAPAPSPGDAAAAATGDVGVEFVERARLAA